MTLSADNTLWLASLKQVYQLDFNQLNSNAQNLLPAKPVLMANDDSNNIYYGLNEGKIYRQTNLSNQLERLPLIFNQNRVITLRQIAQPQTLFICPLFF
ncbi:hypothetical protein [Aliikangiella maris]|uniref:Uncharacterized protein n=2 Tax=Aliikangiella maris TaxID=3162458 RepID=A0ABV2BXK9_9GAMM